MKLSRASGGIVMVFEAVLKHSGCSGLPTLHRAAEKTSFGRPRRGSRARDGPGPIVAVYLLRPVPESTGGARREGAGVPLFRRQGALSPRETP